MNFGPEIKQYLDHIVCFYGYKLIICSKKLYSKTYKTSFGEGDFEEYFNDVIKESEYCSKKIVTEFY